MAEYIEGKHPAIEALRSRLPIERVLLADNLQYDDLVKDVVRKAKQRKIPVEKVPRGALDKRSARGSHQGVMVQTKPYRYAGLGDVLAHANAQAERNGGAALIVVLDHITDEGNLGAIARSAEVVGASGIVIPNKRSARITAATYKSSAGAIMHLPVAQVANLGQSLERLKGEGYWVAGASEKAAQSIWKNNLKGKICLVMGNEGEGIARLVQERCDFFCALPQVGKTASLNVAQSATAIMYEWLRQNAEALQLG